MEAVVVLAPTSVSEPFQGVLQPTGQQRPVEESLCVGFQRIGLAVDIIEADLALDETIPLSELRTERQHVVNRGIESSFCAHVYPTRWPTILLKYVS
ncbi:hypothetical protein DU504_17500 [Haloplanus salinus]|uniref:Uncharacterized protein n=1 Tax=Haloplanus salinus TaxID=1126245 RepID=A0A368N349_9EURY|nr:hypothetical protein DU504_17500 [Haloplanus salinus]